jgi:hypothetical protein
VLWTVNSVPSRIVRSSRLIDSSIILLADTWSSFAEQNAMVPTQQLTLTVKTANCLAAPANCCTYKKDYEYNMLALYDADSDGQGWIPRFPRQGAQYC